MYLKTLKLHVTAPSFGHGVDLELVGWERGTNEQPYSKLYHDKHGGVCEIRGGGGGITLGLTTAPRFVQNVVE